MMRLPVRDSRRLTIRAATVALLATLALALPATARAAAGPRFLLAAAPHGAVVHSRPHGPTIATLPGSTAIGSPTWLWVTAITADGRWGRVVLPIQPNGLTGWIDLHGLAVARTQTWVRASLNERTLSLMHGRRALAIYPVAIGAPATPTPVGRFSVTDRVATGDPSGPYGWYAFGLSGHQPHLPSTWGGGDQLAIHGTNDQASIGTAASHGCMRVPTPALTRLKAALALGTPVVIMPSRAAAMRSAISASLPRLSVGRHHPLYQHPPTATVPPALFELTPPSAPLLLARTLAGSVAPMAGTAPPAVRPRSAAAPTRPPAARVPRAAATHRHFVPRSAHLRPVRGAGRSPPRAPPR